MKKLLPPIHYGESAGKGRKQQVLLLTAFLFVFAAASGTVFGQEADGATTRSVVTSHYLATEAGMTILREGGNAADAAFTIAAVLSVTEGWFSHVLGGGTWALHYAAESGEVTSLDGVGPAGSHATADFYRLEENSGRPGIHQAIVPGAWDGWMIWLDRFGSMELPELLAPALELAEDGAPVTRTMANWIQRDEELIRSRPETSAVFLPAGRVPAVGSTIVQSDLADTFGALLDAYREARPRGRSAALQAASDYYYRGPIAEKIVAWSDEHGGLFDLSDFHDFHARFREPISIDYKGITVYQNPPNSQGITMLMGLNILEGYEFSDIRIQSPEMIHLIAEAIKLAHADKYFYVGDPDKVDVPVRELLSEQYARSQRERIAMDEVREWPIEPGLRVMRESDTHTTTFQIVDDRGNGVSVTTSLGAQFLVIGDTGIIINNRMRMFEVDKDNPNVLEPLKKVRHTSNPYLAVQDGKLYILGGNTGVDSQPQGQIQQFIYVVEYGLHPQDAVSRSRFITQSFPSSQRPYTASGILALEGGYSEEVRRALERMGHKVGRWATFGNANMTVIDPQTGEIRVGADPRGENLGMAE